MFLVLASNLLFTALMYDDVTGSSGLAAVINKIFFTLVGRAISVFTSGDTSCSFLSFSTADGRGGLQTGQGLYPALRASSGLLKTSRFSNVILSAHLQVG